MLGWAGLAGLVSEPCCPSPGRRGCATRTNTDVTASAEAQWSVWLGRRQAWGDVSAHRIDVAGERQTWARKRGRDFPVSWPGAWTPGEAQLADLELLTIGAFEPLQGFMTSADLAAMAERGTLADGTPWPIPVTLEVPEDAVPAGASHLVLQDQEGTPLAILQITEQLPIRGYSYGEQALSGWRLAGPVTPLREPEHGPFRRLRRTAGRGARRARQAGDGPVLASVTRGRCTAARSGSFAIWPTR